MFIRGNPDITIRGGLGIYWGLTAKAEPDGRSDRIGAALCFSGVRGLRPKQVKLVL
jgi:hypothetical protein